jgi:hypothetical protein
MEDFIEIEHKKPIYKIKAPLREHLRQYSRLANLPISYDDLLRFQDLIPLTDYNGDETLWFGALYNESENKFFHNELINIYQMLVADGDEIPYLKIESIDFCSFGNSKPFRIKVINEVNDNHDYFYIKKADASRIYGLELEEIFSPDKVVYFVDKMTLVEDHIVGIPSDDFVKKNIGIKIENRLRFAKEFVKFNERCFVRLLGDMRGYNFVVEITQDFDNVQYRLRPMDFDQQSYEGRKNIYLPQYFKDNIELVKLAQELMSNEIASQYAKQERVAMKKRYLAAKQRTKSILRRMKKDTISSKENVATLGAELAVYHKNDRFLEMKNMGDILTLHVELKLGITVF